MTEEKHVHEAANDAEHSTPAVPQVGHNPFGATFSATGSVEEVGEERRRDRLAAWVTSGIFVGLAIALGLFLVLR